MGPRGSPVGLLWAVSGPPVGPMWALCGSCVALVPLCCCLVACWLCRQELDVYTSTVAPPPPCAGGLTPPGGTPTRFAPDHVRQRIRALLCGLRTQDPPRSGAQPVRDTHSPKLPLQAIPLRALVSPGAEGLKYTQQHKRIFLILLRERSQTKKKSIYSLVPFIYKLRTGAAPARLLRARPRPSGGPLFLLCLAAVPVHQL